MNRVGCPTSGPGLRFVTGVTRVTVVPILISARERAWMSGAGKVAAVSGRADTARNSLRSGRSGRSGEWEGRNVSARPARGSGEGSGSSGAASGGRQRAEVCQLRSRTLPAGLIDLVEDQAPPLRFGEGVGGRGFFPRPPSEGEDRG